MLIHPSGGARDVNGVSFNGSDEYFSLTYAGASSQREWIAGGWFDFTDVAATMIVMGAGADTNTRTDVFINDTDDFPRLFENAGAVNQSVRWGTTAVSYGTWQHLLFSYRSATAESASTRWRVWLAGTELSLAGSPTVPNNYKTKIGDNDLHTFGRFAGSASGFLSGSAAQLFMIADKSIQAGDFVIGDFLEGTGAASYWKDITDLAFTGNSVLLDFQDPAALGTDYSGLGNDYTANNIDSSNVVAGPPTS